jgi:signal transduction histidine kinase
VNALRRALAAVAVAGLVTGAGAATIILSSDHLDNRGLYAALGLLIGWPFIGVGLFAWWRRPANRFGALMTAVGFTWFIGALTGSDSRFAFTVGVWLSMVYVAVFAHMLLTYPEGSLRTRFQRILVASGYTLATGATIPYLLIADPDDRCEGCPKSLLQISENGTLYRVFDVFTTVLALVLIGLLLVIVVQRWRVASPPQRRAMAPVLWSGAALLFLFTVSLTTYTVVPTSTVTEVLQIPQLIVFASVPWAFLFGILRSRVTRAGRVAELLMRLGEQAGRGGIRELLANALGDRSLQLTYWLEDQKRWVDDRGRPATLPAGSDPARAWTPVELEGERVGAIVHDASLGDDPDLVRSVAAAAGLAVQNGRLQAQLRARVEQLRTSRARIVEAGLVERRRLERNLHDGAQQRLVALSLALRLARAKLVKDPGAADRLLEGAQQELDLALQELRELARGIHPAVLADRGLEAAIETLAGRSPVHIELVETPRDRLPEPVEAAAYFVIAEALTNVAKYAQASQATVRVTRRNGEAVVEVADDGVGGADPQRGSGLRGLADRVAALDGRLEVHSPPGAGTRLRAEIPV